MTETERTTRFALLFFIYFMGISAALPGLPFLTNLSDSTYLLLAQLVCFAPPLVLYFVYTKKDMRQTLRLNPLGWKNTILVIAIAVSMQPIMTVLSYLTSLFFPNPVEQSIGGIQQSGLFISLLSVAIIPAFFEEFFSRGILLSGYRFLGRWKASFFSALLFALLHMNPQQLPYAFVVGFLFCFLVDRTDSLYAGILPHMVINGTTVFSIFTESAATGPVEMEASAILFSLLLMALLSVPWLALLLFAFLKGNPPKADLQLMDESGRIYSERVLTPAMLLIFLIFIVYGILPYINP